MKLLRLSFGSLTRDTENDGRRAGKETAELDPDILDNFKSLCVGYESLFGMQCHDGRLDRKLVKKLTTKEQYQKIMTIGKEKSENFSETGTLTEAK
jgi:hypothetical protein